MPVLELTGLDLAGKRVLIRQDLNVPVRDGVVTSAQRIEASLPAIRHCIDAGARLMYGHDPEFWAGVPQAPAEVVVGER